MKLFAAILLCVALVGGFVMGVAPVEACGGMTTITPPPFDPPPTTTPGPVDPLSNITFEEVIL